MRFRLILSLTTLLWSFLGLAQSRAEENRLSIRKTYTLPRLGPAKMVRTESASGIFAELYRRSLAAGSAKELMKDFESSVDPQIQLLSAKSTDFKDSSKSVTVEGQFQGSGNVDVWPAGTQIFAFPHQLFTGMPNALDPLNERDVRGKINALKKELSSQQDPISLTFPFQREYIFRYKLPAHLDFHSKPDPTRIDLGPASLTLSSQECGTSCFEFRYLFDTGSQISWSVQELQAYADGLNNILDDKLYTISIKPKAFILSEQGRLREALQYAQKVVQSKAGHSADRLTLAQLMQRIGLLEEAQQLARDAAKSQPQEKRILLHAGELLIRGENQKDCSQGSACEEARQLYEQALKLDPSDRFALRTLPLIMVYNENGIRYGKGADLQKVEAAFARAMKSPLADDQEFFNTYLQHLTFTGQWIAMDQVLRRPPDSMPVTISSAWKVIAHIGNQHIDEAKQELDQLLAKGDGSDSMQGLIKELMQDRRYKEGSQLFLMLKDRLPQVSQGAAEALAVMEPCPDEPIPSDKIALSLQQYICTMLAPDSTLTQGLQFVPSFAQQDTDYKKYFEQVEWDRRLENSRADPSLPPYFVIDSASTAYEIQELQKLQDGTLISLRNTKVFAASPFAAPPSEESFDPRLLAVKENGSYRFISLDAPSVISLLWFRSQSKGLNKASEEYAKILGDLLDRSLKAQESAKKQGPEGLHYQDILKNFRPLLQGNTQDQELAAAIFSPAVLNDQAVEVFERNLAKKSLKSEQFQLLELLLVGRLITLKKTTEALQHLNHRSAEGPITFPFVQAMLELARTGRIKAEEMKALIEKLEASEFEERLSLLAEIKHLLGDQKGAERVYEQWLKNPSSNGLAENNAAWFYFTSGKSDIKALKLAQSASEKAKTSVANLNTLASIQAELGLTNDSIATQLQYRNLLGDRDLGSADDLVTAINAEKMGLNGAALKRLKKIQVDPESLDLKALMGVKIQRLEKSRK